MRQGEGAAIHLFNGRHGEWRATLVEPRKKVWAARADERLRSWAPGPDLDLVIAVVKRGRLETIVEKAAELGARRVIPVLTERTNAPRASLDRSARHRHRGRPNRPAGSTSRSSPNRPGWRIVLRDWQPGRRLMFCDGGRRRASRRRGPGPRGAVVRALGGADRSGGRLLPRRTIRGAGRRGVVAGVAGAAHPARRYRRHRRPHPVAVGHRRLARVLCLSAWVVSVVLWPMIR